MIFCNKSLKYFFSSYKVFYKSIMSNSVLKFKIRLFCTEMQVLPKKTLRSMQNKKTQTLDPFGWALLVIPISAFGLGTWQVQRKLWKDGLVEDLKKRTQLPPVDFPQDINQLKDMEYHAVRVKGKFDHSREIFMGPRTKISQNNNYSNTSSLLSTSSSGFLVITPFILTDRDLTILVNRGWVPSNQKSPNTRLEGQIKNEVEVVGLVRHSEPRQPLGMKNIPEKGFWQYRDLNKFSEATGAAPILIDAVPSSDVPGGPLGGQTIVGLRNDHFSYLVTWYTLCAATGYMWYARYLKP